MISVRNRLPQLNGNSYALFLLAALFLSSCSQKVRWVSKPANIRPETPAPEIKKKPKPVKPAPPQVSVISLLLPFGLNHIGPGLYYTDSSLEKARIAAEYYEGFKLALDSLTSYGYNYKLRLYDSRDDLYQARLLAYNTTVYASDLVVGPVFPDDMKAFAAILTAHRKPIVSPLAPDPPEYFRNQNLVVVNPPLEYHALCVAKYITSHIKPQKIFVLRSGYSADNDYINPFKTDIDTLSKHRVEVIAVTIKRGQLSPLLSQLSTTRQNVFVVPSTDQQFLMITLRSLDTLSGKYPVVVFGHPSWAHFSFLNTQLLERLKTHITSADDVDYKSPKTVTFIRDFRNTWHQEPTSFAIKGFDEGLYFGRLLANGALDDMAQIDFNGLHNDFHFVKKPGLGWVNTHVNLLLYSNFELIPVQ